MQSSQFEAKTFGVGELIMQRKLFRVPPHQRSFAWGRESVEEFLDDIETSRENRASDYFIGLIVIQGSPDGEWILLDGQQRLTTVSLIYAAARYWLHSAGFEEDAKQINHDYLGVRRLGGEYSSRMLLNSENQDNFTFAATILSSDSEMMRSASFLGKKSSNRLLLEAAMSARKWVNELAGEKEFSNKSGALHLYDLARFLDSKLKVVAVEVSSEVDAYVLFESLNDRGVALSALDLIKNYIFSRTENGYQDWEDLLVSLGDSDPEDFLKVFWTSRYGVVQKAQIFKSVKARYSSEDEVFILLREMTGDAALVAALYDSEHPIWNELSVGMRDQIYLLRLLESKQVRPLLLAIIRSIRDWGTALRMIRVIASAIVRFQVIGRGRTGVVEKVLARLCTGVHSGQITSVLRFRTELTELITQDAEFHEQFLSYSDSKYSRMAYMLAEDLVNRNGGGEIELSDRISLVREVLQASTLESIYEQHEIHGVVDEPELARLLGNYYLAPKYSDDHRSTLIAWERIEKIANASDLIRGRQLKLADAAVAIWADESWGVP